MNRNIYSVILGLNRRSERVDPAILQKTFVDEEGYLTATLMSYDNQVIYGRRGTGKTHALKYLERILEEKGDSPIYIDIRRLSSNHNIYHDTNITLSDRATSFIIDILEIFYDYIYTISTSDTNLDFDLNLLDSFNSAITKVAYENPDEYEIETIESNRTEEEKDTSFNISIKDINAGFSDSNNFHTEKKQRKLKKYTNKSYKSIDFSELFEIFSIIAKELNNKHIWFLLDEWVNIPYDIQPFVADLIRRIFLPLPNITIKISAIEHRSNFQVYKTNAEYIGFELGADVAAVLDLDDFMVFDNNKVRSIDFFEKLLFNHYISGVTIKYNNIQEDIPEDMPSNSQDFIDRVFEDRNVFIEFIRSTEGVPRDGINILSLAAQKSGGRPINIFSIISAARDWTLRDKERTLSTNKKANKLFHHINRRILEKKGRQRTFLVNTDDEHELIEALFDFRVIHIRNEFFFLEANPGERFSLYIIDYGSFVNMFGGRRLQKNSNLTKEEAKYLVPLHDEIDTSPIIIDNEEVEKALEK